MKESLIEKFVEFVKAPYISDLPRLRNTINWEDILREIPQGAYELEEWHEVFSYIFQYKINYDSEEKIRNEMLK